MKLRRLIIIVFLFALESAWSQESLIPFRCGKLWGYRDQQGKIVIDAQYEAASFFSEGFAAVRNNRKIAYINTAGNPITAFEFDLARPFKNGFAVAGYGDPNKKSTMRYVIINKKGKIITDKRYTDINDYAEGVFALKDENIYYLMDTTGQRICERNFNYVFEFKEGLAMVSYQGKYGFINNRCEWVIEPAYTIAAPFRNGWAEITTEARVRGLIDKKGNAIFPEEMQNNFDWTITHSIIENKTYNISRKMGVTVVTDKKQNKILETPYVLRYLSDNYFFVIDNSSGVEKHGIMDKKGVLTVKPTADYRIESVLYHGNTVKIKQPVTNNAREGLMTVTGKILLPAEYSYIQPVSGGYWIKKEYLRGAAFFNKEGKQLTEFEWEPVSAITPFSEIIFNTSNQYTFVRKYNSAELALFNLNGEMMTDNSCLQYVKREGRKFRASNGKWGLVDEDGVFIVEPQYDYMDVFNEGMVAVKKNGKYGYMNKYGQLIVPLEYDSARHFSNGMGPVMKNGLWGFANLEGKLVVPVQYNDIGLFDSDGYAYVETNQYTARVDKQGNEYNKKMKGASGGYTPSSSGGSQKVYCVTLVLDKTETSFGAARTLRFLFFVQVTDQSGYASEGQLVGKARELKMQRNFRGYSESNYLIDTKGCHDTKALADRSGVRYDQFLIEYATIR